MNSKVSIAIIGIMLTLPALSFAGEKARTEYDCRKTVKVRVVHVGPKLRGIKFIKVCPHREQREAGHCETDFWGRMRCTS